MTTRAHGRMKHKQVLVGHAVKKLRVALMRDDDPGDEHLLRAMLELRQWERKHVAGGAAEETREAAAGLYLRPDEAASARAYGEELGEALGGAAEESG